MIWGLDTASRFCGITAGDGSTMPACGAWTFEQCGEDYGLLMHAMWKNMDALAQRLGMPAVVIFESPILKPNDFAKGGLSKLRRLYGLIAVVELWCKVHGVHVEEASSRRLKKRLTGNHLASKDDMVLMCQRLRVPLPTGKAAEDAADSFAAWLEGVTHHAKQHLPAWDQALYSRRGYAL